MKNNLKLVLAFVLIIGIAAAAGAAATWWGMSPSPAGKAADKPAIDTRVHKYVSLDKVIVMLRRSAGETTPHYLAAELVFKTTEDKEKLTKSHLPMLRSEAVKALSNYSLEKAEAMTVTQLAVEIDRALVDRYARDRQSKPFSEVMIGKLIIE
ncbi:flagellar basal body protein [Noviherbaspirillum cavernae]|uniref:Flagellar protein FliL n=1 Tax=Noviherbaspirillum cavernae TaxID=2320862 RepID=A0A418WVI9_9BURK|nr:flagellar basal body-associated FliL family protein [Noviherbaspirillum cavernae]RJF96700.1 flagellar basal body protein [Noviherbaspirillum cavernae]